jgi:hypothetical protein
MISAVNIATGNNSMAMVSQQGQWPNPFFKGSYYSAQNPTTQQLPAQHPLDGLNNRYLSEWERCLPVYERVADALVARYGAYGYWPEADRQWYQAARRLNQPPSPPPQRPISVPRPQVARRDPTEAQEYLRRRELETGGSWFARTPAEERVWRGLDREEARLEPARYAPSREVPLQRKVVPPKWKEMQWEMMVPRPSEPMHQAGADVEKSFLKYFKYFVAFFTLYVGLCVIMG